MSDVTVGAYLFQRLKQLGVQTIFGVPGGKNRPRHTCGELEDSSYSFHVSTRLTLIRL
jgi:thiamine pyrophosphate-dependent acetolactate synthase large subunit-like protein